MKARSIYYFSFLTAIYALWALPAYASDVVLNEFLVDPDKDQWVELYNKGNSEQDISGWFIDDSGGSEKFTVPQGVIIAPKDFAVFQSSYFNLNRTSADTVRLLNGETAEDSFSYSTGPGTDKTYGRDVDGAGNWITFSAPTRGQSNAQGVAAPTPTSTPTPTNPPTPSPKPTATPKPTPTSKPTPTQKLTSALKKSDPTNTSTVAVRQSFATASPLRSSPKTTVSLASLAGVLGESSSRSPNVASPSQEPKRQEVTVLGVFQKGLSVIFIALGGGIFLAACGILAFRYLKKRKEYE